MALLKSIWRKAKRFLPIVGEYAAPPSMKQSLIDLEIRALLDEVRGKMPDNPILSGHKVYSQVDEDGIIQDICRRLNISHGSFVELGCGNGTENNTHCLLLKGWKGVWIDGSTENIKNILKHIPSDTNQLLVQQLFLTIENIGEAFDQWIKRFNNDLDLLSLDIDGNDAAILKEILKTVNPKILVVEYNGKYPPPMRLSIRYNATHKWQANDYYGSSLQVFVDLLKGYSLVCCNVSGANAFFVRSDFANHFTDYPVERLYMHARNHLVERRWGAPPSLLYLKDIVSPWT